MPVAEADISVERLPVSTTPRRSVTHEAGLLSFRGAKTALEIENVDRPPIWLRSFSIRRFKISLDNIVTDILTHKLSNSIVREQYYH